MFLSLVLALLLQCTFSAIPGPELDALVDFYIGTGGQAWTVSTNWLSGKPCENNWYGVQCNEDKSHVTALLLTANNLVGSIPASIGTFTELVALDFNGNQLSGSIPSSFASCKKLYAVGMTFNKLSGSLPPEIGNLQQLQFFHLDFNSLSGPIPASFYNLTQLKYVGLYGNQLSGSLSSFQNMKNLEMLFLDGNKLTGPLPDFSGMAVRVVGLKGNQLTGSITDQFGNMANLQELQLQENKLSGALPLLSSSSEVIFWTGYTNSLSGSLGTSYGALSGLTFFDMHDNQLTGLVPDWVQNLQGRKVNLADNPFKCPIPSWAAFTGATCKSDREHVLVKEEESRIPHSFEREREPSDRVQVDIFGMAKCPDMKSIEDVFGALSTKYPTLDSIMDLTLGFIGASKEDEPTGIYTMHGQTEAFGELFEICVLEHYSNGTQRDWNSIFSFLGCVNSNQQDIPSNVEDCATKQGLSYTDLMKCALGDDARQALQASVALAAKFQAVWSPTVFLDGARYCLWDSEPCGAQKPDDFVAAICKLYKGSPKPACCSAVESQ